jgi:hypothetical protein
MRCKVKIIKPPKKGVQLQLDIEKLSNVPVVAPWQPLPVLNAQGLPVPPTISTQRCPPPHEHGTVPN